MKHAFSLVELSIVLVILGLLTGGILAGQSLIRASQLRSVITDLDQYRTATQAFRDKYLAIAGDMTNATSFWGLAGGTTGDATDTACQNTASTDARTCNGNGDGMLDGYESYRHFQHLANAGMMPGKYVGRGYSAGPPQKGCTIGWNCPIMRVPNMTWRSDYSAGITSANVNRLPYPPGHYFHLGNPSVAGGGNNDVPFGAVLSTEESWNLDMKTDDGKPHLGAFQSDAKKGATASWLQDVNNCTIAATATTDYDLARTGLSCAFRVRVHL